MENTRSHEAFGIPVERRTLPEALLATDEMRKVRQGFKQWSQIVAWSWLPGYFAYEGEPEKVKGERLLRNLLIKTLQEQAVSTYAWESYNDLEKMREAQIKSIKLKKILMCIDFDQILESTEKSFKKPENYTVTLSDVYIKMTGKNLNDRGIDITSFRDKKHMQQFHLQVITNSFYGSIREIKDYEKKILMDMTESTTDREYVEKVKYVNQIAYPPRPSLGKSTITRKKLKEYIQDKTTNYLPPSAYLPVCDS